MGNRVLWLWCLVCRIIDFSEGMKEVGFGSHIFIFWVWV